MSRKRKFTAEELEPYLLAEAVRRHYMSLEGGGPAVFEESLFFLQWHYDNAENDKDIGAWQEAGRLINGR